MHLLNSMGSLNRQALDLLIGKLMERDVAEVARDSHGKEALVNFLKNGADDLRGVPPGKRVVIDGDIDLYADAESERRNEVANALMIACAVTPDVRTVNRLLALSKDAQGNLRMILSFQLGQFSDSRVVEPLIAWLGDPDLKIGQLAADGLELHAPGSARAKAALDEYRKLHPAPVNSSVIHNLVQPVQPTEPLRPTNPDRPPALPAASEF